MKTCKKCSVQKLNDDFYNKDTTCKECRKKLVKENRLKNLDYYLEYDRQRGNLLKRVEARAKYSQTEAGKKALQKAKDKYREKNLIKRAAHVLVGNAVRDGKITKPSSCENCGKESTIIHGHHDDYAYPLQVRWLCSQCHGAWHKANGEALNG
jgi:ribosomal protein S27AE